MNNKLLRGGNPCTELSFVVFCDYVNERATVKLALSVRMIWLNTVGGSVHSTRVAR